MWRFAYRAIVITLYWNSIGASSDQNTHIQNPFKELESRVILQHKVITNLAHVTKVYENEIKALEVTLGEQKKTIDLHEARIVQQAHVCGELSLKAEKYGASAQSGEATPYMKSSYGCVAANVTLSCPENQHIIVEKADYGEWSQGCSTCCPPHPYDCTEPMSDSNYNEWVLLKARCDDQTSCVYKFQGSTFVSQCTVNTPVHYVNIYYSCLPEERHAVVGFTAYASAARNYTLDQVVIFDALVTNLGDHYEASSGIFLCPYSGVYYFSLHMFVGASHLMVASINKEAAILVQAYPRDNSGTFDSASTSVVTNCNPGERIWVAMGTDTGTLNGGRYSSFSGYLLHQY